MSMKLVVEKMCDFINDCEEGIKEESQNDQNNIDFTNCNQSENINPFEEFDKCDDIEKYDYPLIPV